MIPIIREEYYTSCAHLERIISHLAIVVMLRALVCCGNVCLPYFNHNYIFLNVTYSPE